MGASRKPGLVGRSCEGGPQRVQGSSLSLLRGTSKTQSSARGTDSDILASLVYEAGLGRGGCGLTPL